MIGQTVLWERKGIGCTDTSGLPSDQNARALIEQRHLQIVIGLQEMWMNRDVSWLSGDSQQCIALWFPKAGWSMKAGYSIQLGLNLSSITSTHTLIIYLTTIGLKTLVSENLLTQKNWFTFGVLGCSFHINRLMFKNQQWVKVPNHFLCLA